MGISTCYLRRYRNSIGYGLDERYGFDSLEVQEIILFPETSGLDPPSFPSNKYWRLFHRGLWREVDHSPAISAKNKKMWSCISICSILLP
jgi:hypothetical protein